MNIKPFRNYDEGSPVILSSFILTPSYISDLVDSRLRMLGFSIKKKKKKKVG